MLTLGYGGSSKQYNGLNNMVGNDDIDPDIRRFQQALNSDYSKFGTGTEISIQERRTIAEKVRARWSQGGPQMWRTDEVEVNDIRLRIYRPTSDETSPAMLYIHGGGWVMFSVDTHDRLMREYAARANIIVVGIDYSLSPEAKFPVAICEITSAFEWLRREGRNYGINPDQIAMGGDSAGANLTVAACLKMRNDAEPLPTAMLLNYGVFGIERGESYRRYDGPDYLLTVDEMDAFWASYTKGPEDLNNPLAVPLLADLHGLPPTIFITAECDILADGNRAMAQRLRDANVTVDATVYPGATHSFLEAVSISALADQAFEKSASWLQAQFKTA